MKLLMRRAALLFLLAILLALPAGASASGPGEVERLLDALDALV